MDLDSSTNPPYTLENKMNRDNHKNSHSVLVVGWQVMYGCFQEIYR